MYILNVYDSNWHIRPHIQYSSILYDVYISTQNSRTHSFSSYSCNFLFCLLQKKITNFFLLSNIRRLRCLRRFFYFKFNFFFFLSSLIIVASFNKIFVVWLCSTQNDDEQENHQQQKQQQQINKLKY